jgi:hypothetical protein
MQMPAMGLQGLQGLAVTARSFRKLQPSAIVVLCLVKLPGTVLGEVFLNPSRAGWVRQWDGMRGA